MCDYILKRGADLGFTKCFWRECEPLSYDVDQYEKFVTALQLVSKGIKQTEIADQLDINHNSINKWTHLMQMPKLGHFLKAYLTLGIPKQGRVWLTLEQTHGHAVPAGQFIEAPQSIASWQDVEVVIEQIKPIEHEAIGFNRIYLFDFLLGMILGDANKSKQGRGHRHIGLVMSKKYETNEKIGNFTCQCAKDVGLRMERRKDHPKPFGKPHEFYEWTSQSSPLIDWIYYIALGLKDGQHTTYDPVQMDWAIESPKDFRVGLIQGIAESDGSVSIASQTVEFWIIPNWDFMIRFLATFGLHAFRNREAVSLVKSQAIASYGVPVFSDYLQTVRYQRLRLMATTPRLDKEDRVPEEIRREIIQLRKQGYSVPKIVETIAQTRNLLVSFEAAQRWARKEPVGECQNGNSGDLE